MKRIFALLLAAAVLLGCCGCQQSNGLQQFQTTYFDLFDTVTQVIGFCRSDADFQAAADQIYEKLQFYHRLFDIYHDYPGISNIKTINDQAGIAPVQVDSALIDLLLCCKEYYTLTGGKVNFAMGSVLRLWHETRTAALDDPTNAQLPDPEALAQAATHTDPDCVIIDKAASTVYLSDPALSLDVGAIAKGWAAQQVAQIAPAGLLISIGGNVLVTGPKNDQGDPWLVGIQNPEADGNYLHAIRLSTGSAITSGDYQRTYQVDGVDYHHIIDPQTQMPGRFWRSVTVVCEDSALGDALSTALFLMDLETGKALAAQVGVEVLWLDLQGQRHTTPGFADLIHT